jgi:uncharacterized protein (TIGR03032 family)
VWLLQAGTGYFGFLDGDRFEPVTFCPGFLRGLDFIGDYAIVGLSKSRRERTFSGLKLDENLKAKDADPRCSIYVIDLNTGSIVHWLRLEGYVQELYDVAALPGFRRPMAIGLKTDEIQRIITLPPDAMTRMDRSAGGEQGGS